MDKPTKKKRPYSHEALMSSEFCFITFKKEHTMLPSELCLIPIDIEWNEEDVVDPDELVYSNAYAI